MDPLSPTSSTDSSASIEIGDFLFCCHGKERCSECSMDFREDNAFTGQYGVMRRLGFSCLRWARTR
jgi:hypothetical protein